LILMNADGTGATTLFTVPGTYSIRGVDWSPDGTRLAFGVWTAFGGQLLTIPVGGGTPTVLTSEPAALHSPVWSPDGTEIASLEQQVAAPPATPGHPAERQRPASGVTGRDRSCRVSPDGRALAFTRINDAGEDIHILIVDASGAVEPVVVLSGTRSNGVSWR
jgi:Tol biopolymer transport system component